MEQKQGGTGQAERPGESADAADLEAQIVEELKRHADVEISWDKWYCDCGFRLRSGYSEFAAHREAVAQKLRGSLQDG